jgi:hypothetical protein
MIDSSAVLVIVYVDMFASLKLKDPGMQSKLESTTP